MAPELTIEEINPDSVIVEGQLIMRRTASRSEWLKFWQNASQRQQVTLQQAWEAGHHA